MALAELADQLDGDVYLPASAGYRAPTTPWSASATQHPVALAVVSGADDVVACVQAARRQGLRLAPPSLTGMLSYAAAGVLGALLAFPIALMIFLVLPPFYAVASEGLKESPLPTPHLSRRPKRTES